MKFSLLLILVGVALVGCSKSDDDGTVVKPQVAQNPSGKPRNSEESARAQQEKALGDQRNAEAAAAAQAQKDAMAKTGGK